MARPLRIEFEGALYHVMARGNAWADIFLCDTDRQAFIDNLTRVCNRFDWRVWAWCQMTNHYHLLVETLRLFHTKRGPARRAYARFVADGVNTELPFDQMPRPGFLGTESFIETILEKFDNASVSTEVPKKLRPARSLEQIARAAADRDQAITQAYWTGGYTLTEIARHFGIHQSTASRIARREGNA